MYEKYWGIKEKPFENAPDPRFVYYSKQHEQAFIRMMYAIKEEKGAAMLTGEYGSGKTLLSRVIVNELIKNNTYEAALITYPKFTSIQFLQEIIYQLGNSNITNSRLLLLHRLQEIIYKNFKDGKKTVIIVDEAQIIKDQGTFEELRLLLNFQLNDRFLLTLVIIGQPELIEKVNDIPQFEQRIGIKFYLRALNRKESEEYIRYRLSVAGRSEPIFTNESFDLIYDYSGGVPRKINNICDIALLLGFGQTVKRIDGGMLQRVIGDFAKMGGGYA